MLGRADGSSFFCVLSGVANGTEEPKKHITKPEQMQTFAFFGKKIIHSLGTMYWKSLYLYTQ